MVTFIAYYRVSTEGQGKSGLGLAAQQQAVNSYVGGVGGQILDSFQEIESGKNDERLELQKALSRCKASKSMLVIAKLDRLARNVSFIANLMESRIPFVAADMPHANKLTVHIIAAMAEYERDQISARTKAALKQAKERGQVLGNKNLSAVSRLGSKRNKTNADTFAQKVSPQIHQMSGAGMSLQSIALALNDQRVQTPRGGKWWATTVSNVLKRQAANQN
jgi:DNA invertase Pin-like site-specific DNA recombinase